LYKYTHKPCVIKVACCAMWHFTQVLLDFGLRIHASF
jgi:hypothetical protein